MDKTPGNDLYSPAAPMGLLKGFSAAPNQLELDVVVPYSGDAMPGFGEFLLAELGPTDALVGRVSRFSAAGHLVSPQGDAYLADLAKTDDTPPAPIMRQMLRYTMKMQLLGHLRWDASAKGAPFRFLVGERAFATLGSRVRLPSDAALAFFCNIGLENDPSAAVLGHLAYGQRVLRNVPVKFSVDRLKGRRSFVFARAGYGKSNLMKYLIAKLYSTPPDVGLLIFDPEGEYALPDAEGRPALANVPQLRERISLYTHRAVAQQYASVKKGEAFVNFGDFPPQEIVAAFIPQEKQELVFANTLRGLDWDKWRQLVELLSAKKHQVAEAEIAAAIGYRLNKKDDVMVQAIRNNLVPPIARLHRAGGTLGQNLISELKQGRIVILDTSLLGSEEALATSGLLLQKIFAYNRKHFTEPVGSTVRCLAVIEEAQTVLGDRRLDDSNIFVRWVKEGRKYGLGCVLVTQQPGAISDQIISQGDNFFAMHLLNDDDLKKLCRHNAYYTDDILSFIRNEPIRGNCYFWSAPDQPFVLSARVADFASVTEAAAEPAAGFPARASAPKADRPFEDRLRQLISESIAGDARVWLYQLESATAQVPYVVFSQDYLMNTVAERIGVENLPVSPEDSATWFENDFPQLVKKVLAALGAHSGYAVLAGGKRPAWALAAKEVQLAGGKQIKSQRVVVTRTL